MKRLTEEYKVLNNEFEDFAERHGCSCHINPPCAYCTHEGNPENLLETPEAWEEIEENTMEFKFEQIDDYHQRAKVQGGWLVKAFEDVAHLEDGYRPSITGFDYRAAMAFVPDPEHSWEISPETID